MQANTQQQKPVQNQPEPAKKDVSSHEAARRIHVQQPQIGMALIPETPMDFSVVPPPSNAWMTALPNNDFQVYAVTELPEPPVLDLEHLSGKLKSSPGVLKPSKTLPRLLEQSPLFPSNCTETKATQLDESVELDREAFALYFDSPATAWRETAVDDDASDDEKLARLEKLCSDLDELCTKIADLAPHMI